MSANPLPLPATHAPCQDDAALTERVCAPQELLVQGRFLRMVRDHVELPDGVRVTREYVQHPGAVVIVAALDATRWLVERQYRHPLGQVVIEFPAGKRDANEEALACAQRELREETGFQARQWAFAGAMHNAIAYSTERIDIWFARDLHFVGQKLDAAEHLSVHAATLGELLSGVRQGHITDAKTITCLLWLQQMQAGAWTLDWR